MPLAGGLPGVSVIVLNLDRPEYLLPLIDQLEGEAKACNAAGLGFQLLIGDTGSTDPEVLRRYDELPDFGEVVPGLEYHFGRCNNTVARNRVRHSHLLLLNNDVSFAATPGAVLAMHEVFENDDRTGAVGLALDFPDGTVQHMGIDLVRNGHRRGFTQHVGSRQPAQHRPGMSWPALAATGACLMVRSDLWSRLGGLDESYMRECQDVDLCLRLRRLGYEIRVVDAGPAVHVENGTRDRGDEDARDRQLFVRRWRSFLEAAAL
jgi:GT2 family glycosyltransferase